MISRVVRLVVIALAMLAFVIPLPPFLVERIYSRGAYLWLQAWLTPLTNRLPFALFDLLLGIALGAALLALLSLLRHLRSPRRLWQTARRVLVASAAVYLAFLVCWGLNYQRRPLTAKLDFSADRPAPGAVLELATEAVTRLNALGDQAHAEGFPEWSQMPDWLGPAYAQSQNDLASGRHAVPGIPKASLLSVYFERAGVDGMTDPFFLEVLVNQGLLPFERPFVVAHEWAHLAGYADESEANFVGWLTCLRGPAGAQYSGWLFLYSHVMAALPRADRMRVGQTLAEGPRQDLRAAYQRLRSIQPIVRTVSWSVYDRYLKANRVESGTASYDRVVLLVLGTRFRPGWIPVLRIKPWTPTSRDF
jgi:hypothetical protein